MHRGTRGNPLGRALNKAMASPMGGALLEELGRHSRESYVHSLQVARIALTLNRELGLNLGQRRIAEAGVYHDVGKMIVPRFILHKEGRPTGEEFDVIKFHPEAGRDLLAQSGSWMRFPKTTLAAAYLHHAPRYPAGTAEQLNAGTTEAKVSKLMTIADIIGAMRQKRSYKDPAPWNVVIDTLRSGIERGEIDPVLGNRTLRLLRGYDLRDSIDRDMARMERYADRQGVQEAPATRDRRAGFEWFVPPINSIAKEVITNWRNRFYRTMQRSRALVRARRSRILEQLRNTR